MKKILVETTPIINATLDGTVNDIYGEQSKISSTTVIEYLIKICKKIVLEIPALVFKCLFKRKLA